MILSQVISNTTINIWVNNTTFNCWAITQPLKKMVNFGNDMENVSD